jgi:5-methyltetrahydropteroyltriglutamate--homocysteine methyltransferase
MQRTKPPFRADQVGSLLRSAPVKAARTKRATGEITPGELKAVEDAEISKLVARQEAIGLQAVTDGEFRRSWWHYDFLSHLDGVELVSVAQGLQFKGTQTKAEGLHVHGKIDFSPSHPMIEHFKYLKSVAKAVPKMTIPSPTALHYRGGRQAIEKSAYPDMEPFFVDLGKAYAKAVRAFGDAGCTYLQLDEVYVAYLCDEAQRDYLRGRGDDPDS